MDVLTIESSAFTEMQAMFAKSQDIIKVQADTILKLKVGLLNCKEVAELTGYNEKTIKSKKEEIGFMTIGKDIKFKPADVEAWIQKHYRAPKR